MYGTFKLQEEYMQIVRLLSFVVNVYMMVIIFRIILTWFPGNQHTKVYQILSTVTDPYLNWFRRFPALRVGFIDLSPIAAMAVLSLVHRVLVTFAFYGTISIGIILTIVVQAFWGALSFLLGFIIIVLVVRLIAHFLGSGTGGPLMRIVIAISQPVLFRISQIIFKNRFVSFTTGLIISIAGLVFIFLILRILVTMLSGMLTRLPI